MVIEPVMIYEELPIVTEAARAELFASLQRSEEAVRNGLGKHMTAGELKSGLRADFEAITGFKVI